MEHTREGRDIASKEFTNCWANVDAAFREVSNCRALYDAACRSAQGVPRDSRTQA